MKIGLPSGLLNEYYKSFWKHYFEYLGIEVVFSQETNKTILDEGVRRNVAEICAPIKIYTGHVVELMRQGVDYVYVPRFVSIEEREAFCPKFMALPNMIETMVPELKGKIVTHNIVAKSDDIATEENFLEVGRKFCKNDEQIREAISFARNKWIEFRGLCVEEKYNCDQANTAVIKNRLSKLKNYPVKIGVIGYVYNVYDSLISMNIIKKLNELGVGAVTFEMLDESQIKKQAHHLERQLFWSFSNKITASAYHFFEDKEISGVIHVTAFGCGPDSFLGKILELDTNKYDKPFMTIRVDEHTGENHLQTRIEAFVDMILQKQMECCV
ncbi:MAG: acyl-CoA dehydratase activase-related protein [Candidatus Gastranaerophilales bacterium]|nr:acyl-CoA dehydratase activase-related protein [Candidatus Gastranaerophilales bacterium]